MKLFRFLLVAALGAVCLAELPHRESSGRKLQSSTNPDFKVIIVGLGFAGVELATLLTKDKETSWVAFEARNTFGGKVQRAKIPTTDVWVALGAAWQHGSQASNPLQARRTECGLKSFIQNKNSVRLFAKDGTEIESGAYEADETSAKKCVEKGAETRLEGGQADQSMRAAWTGCGWDATKGDGYAASDLNLESDYGAKLSDVSSIYYSLGINNGEDHLITDSRGSEEFAGCWLDKHGGGRTSSKLNYNSKVTNINTNTNTLTLANGSTYTFGTLFDTRPIPVVRKNDMYTPALSASRISAMGNWQYFPWIKIFLKFDQSYWDQTQYFVIIPNNADTSGVWYNIDVTGAFPGSGGIATAIYGKGREKYENMTDAELAALVVPDLKKTFSNVPDPDQILIARWVYNPLTMGSFARRTPTASAAEFNKVFAPVGSKGNVRLVSSAYCDLAFGTMHGAILGAQTAYNEWKGNADPRKNICWIQSDAAFLRTMVAIVSACVGVLFQGM